MDVGILDSVIVHDSGTVLGIIPEMQHVCSLSHMNNVLSVQGVVGHRVTHRLTYAQTIRIVEESGGSARLGYLLELTTFLPNIRPGAVIDKIAYGIIFLRNCAEIIHTFCLLEYTIAALSSIGVSR